ncbi:stressosome-associated protein Prli42 [Gottfriedia acidiceleris]|nr:stressosome-associated protein Prli42 [Gottfriedia acidiceleris]
MRKKTQKVVVMIMLISMLATTLLAGIASFL